MSLKKISLLKMLSPVNIANSFMHAGGGGGGGEVMGRGGHAPGFSCHCHLTDHFTSTLKEGRRHHISQNVICPRTFDAC